MRQPNRFRFYGLFYCVVTCIVIVGCNKSNNSNENYEPKYTAANSKSEKIILTIGIHPLYNPEKLNKLFAPIFDAQKMGLPGFEFEIVGSRDYATYDQRILNKEFDIILPNPYQTISAIKNGYNVFAKMGDDSNFKGILIVRKSSDLKNLKNLKNKTIAFPAPTALAAAMMPQYYLLKNQINVKNDVHVKYVGSQDSAIMAVYNGYADVGSTWPLAWNYFKENHPIEAKELRILYETPFLINNSLAARNNINKDTLSKIKKYLIKLHESAEGKALLNNIKLSKFEDSQNKQYLLVKDFVNSFNREIGSVDAH